MRRFESYPHTRMREWWNGIHSRLKICLLWVRIPPFAPAAIGEVSHPEASSQLLFKAAIEYVELKPCSFERFLHDRESRCICRHGVIGNTSAFQAEVASSSLVVCSSYQPKTLLASLGCSVALSAICEIQPVQFFGIGLCTTVTGGLYGSFV